MRLAPLLAVLLALSLTACDPRTSGAPEGSGTERGGESRYEEAILPEPGAPDDADPVPQNPGETVADPEGAALADSALGG